MSTTKTTPTPQPAGQTQALFDPFWNGGAHWQGASAQHSARWNSIAGQDALTQFEAIALQFQGAAAGWKALRLTPPRFDATAWATPSQRDMLEGLLTEIAPPTRDGFIFILPNASVVILMYHPDANGLVPLVYKISAMLVGEENAPRTAVNLLDLGNPDHTLACWPTTVKQALDKQTITAQTQHTEAVLRTITASLNPTAIAAAKARLGTQPHQRLMVVEDDPSTNLLLTTLLEDMVKTCTAANAVQAAQTYELYIPALVLLDLGLPDMDGLTVLKHIKAADPAAKVIILTANATRENIQAARALGADGFLAKPFTRAKLQEALQDHGLIRASVV